MLAQINGHWALLQNPKVNLAIMMTVWRAQSLGQICRSRCY
jgi:hypothetical protein